LGELRRRGLTIGTFLGVSATPYRAALPSPARFEDLSRTLESLPAWRALPQPARETVERDLASRAKTAEIAPTALVGNLLNMVAARVAHAFDLTGPSLAIDTACSSSLVAVHLACEALKRGECDVALAGGVHLSLDPDVWHFLKAAGVLSPTGRCVPFANGADGIVPGEGGAILVLRRWSDARAAADPVRAAILGSAIGGDGRAISPMVPNPRGQRATIEAAYRNAGVEPQSIAALEAHGTGTLIGDPIELGVQAEVFSLAPAGSIAVGSVKSNLGHLLAAAGIAGLTKMIVSLERRELPPTLHAQPPNPRLPLANSPLRIAHRRTRLDASHPLRAGVSAFGFGGTNAHVVLERAEPVAARPIPLPACALPLSAPSREHLEDCARALAECDVPTEPLCRELSRGRTTHATRAVRVLRTGDDARASLSDFAAGRVGDWLLGNPEPMAGAGLAVLLFPGQGAQSVQQARGLLECWPAFRERFTGLIEKSQAQEDLFAACYGAGASDATVRRTDIAQPLLVAFQIALAQTVIDAGISPIAVVGHSVGELSAAAIAGAMDPAQAVQLAAVRGSLMQQRCRPGAMIAVALPADSLAPYLADHLDSLSIASLNAPDQTVVAGAPDAITALASRLERDAVAVVRIAVEHAFHSPLVLPVLDELEQHCRTIETRDPVVPLASTVHGRFAGPGELDAQYWRDHAALPVRFEEALRAAAGEPQDGMRASWFLEIGPGTALSKLAKRILGRGDVRPVVSLCRNPSDRDDGADVARALHALGSGWVCGASVDWARFQPSTPGAFARIPSIPFRRKHLRIDEPSAPKATRLIHRWVWEELPRSPAKPSADGDWLVIGSPAADPLVIALRESGRRVIRALPSQSFAHRSDDELSLDPSDVTQWQRALEAIDSAGRSLAGWVIAAPHDRDDAVRWIHASVAASPSSRGAPSAWIIVDDSAPEPSSRAAIATFAAAALDERESRGRVVELAGSLDESSAREVIEELGSEGPRRIRLDGVRIAPRVIAAQGLSFDGPEPFRAGAIYLVIGGTGGVGSLIAQRIAARGGNVVLASWGTASAALLSTFETYGVGASHVSMDAMSEA
ncbi:MAG TPA: acyltransferase domain-containing protein, partial [Polyangiaceae bacterium]|nr:acyltransferase domain-containing protein [Polyangiaceae bacterium]